MPALTSLLIALERYDTLTAEDALRSALAQVMEDGDAPEQLRTAGLHLFQTLIRDEKGEQAWQLLVSWSEERLNNWHSLKLNALEAAWKTDPEARDLERMRAEVLRSLRQGVHDNPELLADAHVMQALARGGHALSFNQAIRELRQEGMPLPDDAGMRTHCALVANAFSYLII